MPVEMHCKPERKGWAWRVSKWVAVNEVEPPARVSVPRLCKRLKKKRLARTLCRKVSKNIEIKGLAGGLEVGERRVAIFM
jgi:hypothetical protein